MARIPDLVSDTELKTTFVPDCTKETVHSFNESDRVSGRRNIVRTEHWHRRTRIGKGGYGEVWIEKCIKGGKSGSPVVRAVKQMPTGEHVERSQYLRELEAIAKFSQQKYENYFVKSFGWYTDTGHLFIAMEYLELGDLFTYTKQRPRLPEDEVMIIIHQTLEALEMMHDNKFAHRDLKLSNILIQSHPPNNWWIKLADFGISKRVDVTSLSHRSLTQQGTPGYMAPELWRIISKGNSYATDMWAIGAITFHLLTKHFPFDFNYLVEWAKGNCACPTQFLHDALVSEFGIDFIVQTTPIPPDERLSVQTALSHKWFEGLTKRVQAPSNTLNEHPTSSSNISSARDDNSTLGSGDLVHTLSSIPGEESSIRNGGDTIALSVSNSRPSLRSIPRTEALTSSSDHEEEVTVQDSHYENFRHHKPIKLGRGKICAMAFSLDGRVALATNKGHIALCRIENGSQIWLNLEPSRLPTGKSSPITTIALSPNGELIAIGTESGVLSVRSTSRGTILKETHLPTRPDNPDSDCEVWDSVFILNGLAAAFLLSSGKVALFLSVDAEPFVKTDIRFLDKRIEDSNVRNMFGPVINRPLTLDDYWRIIAWKYSQEESIPLFLTSENWFPTFNSGVACDSEFFDIAKMPIVYVPPDGELVAYYDPAKKTICVYRTRDKEFVREISLDYIKRVSLGDRAWGIWVESIAISSKTMILAANIHYHVPMGFARWVNFHIIIWSLETGQEISRLGGEAWKLDNLPLLPMDFSPDGTYLMCSSQFGGKVLVWKYHKTKNMTFLGKVRKSITR